MKKKYSIYLFSTVAMLVMAVFLRIWQINALPPSLYWEEVALGYDSYSILMTGKDHHGNPWPIVAFESFGDWKPSGYFYAAIPSIYLFGLNEWAVRLPSALAGISIVIGIFYWAGKIGISKRWALFVATLSPWAIHFSRSAWEVNLATAFLLWGVILASNAVLAKRIQHNLLFVSIFLMTLSAYTYHATRLIAPLMIALFLTIILYKRSIKIFALSSFLTIILFTPFLLSFFSPGVSQRFAETSIFSDISIIEESNARRETENYSIHSRLIYHRYVLFSREILKNYVSHFSPSFLFIEGDENLRHSTKLFGHLYWLDAVFLIIGLMAVFRIRELKIFIPLFLLFISIIPASLTYATPHALRILPSMPVFILIISLGITTVINWLKKNCTVFWVRTTSVLIIGFYLILFGQFWRYYTVIYPRQSNMEWQYGYQEMINELEEKRGNNQNMPVFISRSQGRPAMYYWFYTQANPIDVQNQAKIVRKDQSEFLEYKDFTFFNTISEIAGDQVIVVTSENEWLHLVGENRFQVLDEKIIYNLNEDPVWVIGVLKKVSD